MTPVCKPNFYMFSFKEQLKFLNIKYIVIFAFNIGDQDHDSFFSSIMLKNIGNRILGKK